MWTVYIAICKDGKLYTGITENLARRSKEHTRRGSHFTSYNPAQKVFAVDKYPNRLDAEKRESQIKRWGRNKKLALMEGDLNKLRELSKSKE